jgi:hypothetical protein
LPSGKDGWCWACAKEIKDEFDLLDFKAIMHVPNERLPGGDEEPSRSWISFGLWVASTRQRRARKALVGRSQEEIAAWRAKAGIDTRW